MKKLITTLLTLICVSLFSQTFEIPKKPNIETSVYDYSNLLSSHERKVLEKKLINYADTTSTQIVVAIIPSTNGENIGLLGPRWAHKWGIGDDKKDNGVLILIAKNDKQLNIAPGYGVEHKLIASINGEIIRNVIVPEFKKGNYYLGIDKGVDAIIDVLKGTYKGNPKQKEDYNFPFIIFVIIFIAVIIIINKRNNGGGSSTLLDIIILSGMGRTSGGSGSFGGGFDSGGFGGGFGGGGFSGGGASGSW